MMMPVDVSLLASSSITAGGMITAAAIFSLGAAGIITGGPLHSWRH